MSIRLGVLMDPIHTIHYQKDSTLAMLEEADARQWEVYYFEQQHLFLQSGVVYAEVKRMHIPKHAPQQIRFDAACCLPLAELNIILMRKDPPFNQEYIYTAQLLAHAERAGTLVVNRTEALCHFNEKLLVTYFPQCTVPALVTRSIDNLHAFWQTYGEIVCKPLSGMAGFSVFKLSATDINASVIFETLTQQETQYVMAQQFIPAITQGDKRILLIDGEPIPYALARVPQGRDWRGNLAVGAKGIAQPLTARDEYICAEVGPYLREQGLYFVGLDVIGDYLTEVNITSPTGIRELDAVYDLHISARLLDALVKKL